MRWRKSKKKNKLLCEIYDKQLESQIKKREKRSQKLNKNFSNNLKNSKPKLKSLKRPLNCKNWKK